ncbi:hypothetical protein FPSE_01387 [Fusarium pseudograminearum CS3096]|uniref:Uncharacterized protein n=1 Tax=Fusarium pseudograminearum (strain CS3096) TaxID=1028729 RepID=K3W2X9_FUSPC|nr:hypothetical protein FPSE_01387 [Fusarium pseudograminearum CS3096]EKJ78430.1 hypothetical protein FPSE_01387 [Fusarium pseudograminearum CS3096]
MHRTHVSANSTDLASSKATHGQHKYGKKDA